MNDPLNTNGPGVGPIRSQHYLSRKELLSGLANRFVFSSFYIWLYLSLALLSLTTVVLSLVSDCPTLTFYLLELVINMAMIIEVAIRFVAFGKKFWSSFYNIIDLILTGFCVITVIVIFFSGCSAKGEEVFDTFLLVIRNVIQFSRLAIVLRRSGRSIFTRVPAIDLAAAQDAGYSLDFDLDDEEAELEDRRAAGGDLSAIRAKQAQSSGSRTASRSGTPLPGSTASNGGASQPFLLGEDEDDDSFLESGTRPTSRGGP
ncbi:hypothetical protein P389DRAFT_169133 [Cystobasidium minutum MCA 4210]|uniref:uncharacterized protein n=1 Tax=Cystobasidium minutum MCA 4210 TaxID=1397322 RepID=UPI0034CEBCB4|eukprot:jgi/Rhomi1/169133/fgenesh1_kg.3_\